MLLFTFDFVSTIARVVFSLVAVTDWFVEVHAVSILLLLLPPLANGHCINRRIIFTFNSGSHHFRVLGIFSNNKQKLALFSVNV